MGLENVSFIAQLVTTNPDGATDPKSEGDDHFRLIKRTLVNSFPNITATVTPTPAELNTLSGFLGNTNDLNVLDGAASAGIGTTHIAYLEGLTATIQVQLDAKAHLFKGALVTRTTDLTITHNVWNHISWDAETYDTDTFHDNATNNKRLTVPAGVTRIRLHCHIAVQVGSTGNISVGISKNDETTTPTGVAGLVRPTLPSAANGTHHFNLITAPITVIPTDYFTVAVLQQSGSDGTVFSDYSVATGYESQFSMEVLP